MAESFEFDAVVIGAGVDGLAITNELCEVFDNVLVLDKESDFGQHVSSRHSGVIHSGIYYELSSLKAKLCVQGNQLLYDYAIKSNETNVASAWSNLQSSKSLLASVKSQVSAAEIANEGITSEYESGAGNRSTLDIIQSNSLLLNAKISLSNAERNYLLSQYNLLKSIGLLNSQYLKLQ